LTGAIVLAALAGLLFLAADATASRKCGHNAYGLSVEGGGVSWTEQGCEVTVPTSYGRVSAVLPTLDEGLATVALVVGVAAAIPPSVALWLVTRRRAAIGGSPGQPRQSGTAGI
jgi:hypothetical protein